MNQFIDSYPCILGLFNSVIFKYLIYKLSFF